MDHSEFNICVLRYAGVFFAKDNMMGHWKRNNLINPSLENQDWRKDEVDVQQ
jgi:hypothetical protein